MIFRFLAILQVLQCAGRLLAEEGLESCSGYRGVAAQLVRYDSRYAGVVRSLLGRTVIAEDLDAAVAIAKRYSHRFRIVTLDGQVVNAGGSMTGGYVGKNAGILSRRGEIEKLQAEARSLAGRAKEQEGRLAALRQEANTISALVAGVEAEAKTASEDLAAANAELRRIDISVREAEELGEQSLREFDALTARVEELKNQGLTSAQLVEDEKRIHGNAGCNLINGGFVADNENSSAISFQIGRAHV